MSSCFVQTYLNAFFFLLEHFVACRKFFFKNNKCVLPAINILDWYLYKSCVLLLYIFLFLNYLRSCLLVLVSIFFLGFMIYIVRR